MPRLSSLGFISLFGSLILLLFQSIQALMAGSEVWNRLRIGDILNTDYYIWAEGISLLSINTIVYHIVNMPLYLFLFILSLALLVFSGMFEKQW